MAEEFFKGSKFYQTWLGLMQIISYIHTSAFAHPSLIAQRIQYDPNCNHPIDFFNSATYICTYINKENKESN